MSTFRVARDRRLLRFVEIGGRGVVVNGRPKDRRGVCGRKFLFRELAKFHNRTRRQTKSGFNRIIVLYPDKKNASTKQLFFVERPPVRTLRRISPRERKFNNLLNKTID